MVNPDELVSRGLQAYESGRLRMALRIALLVAPVVALCLIEPVGRVASCCCGLLLMTAAVWGRWRDRAGSEGVKTGLIAGSVPLLGALILTELDPACASAAVLSYCTLFSLLFGAVAGVVVARRERIRGAHPPDWVAAGIIAMLAASLGCMRLGIASVVSVLMGILVGRALGRGIARPEVG
jgi:hypothetical protein